MLYVADINNIDMKIGVADTDDGVVQYCTNKELTRLVHDMKMTIYGTSYYNHEVECTPLVLNQDFQVSKLRSLVDKWRTIHNRWNGLPVSDYLASVKVGTRFIVNGRYKGSDGIYRNERQSLWKVDVDTWTVKDNEILGGINENCSSYEATSYLETVSVYSSSYTIEDRTA